MQEGVEGQCRRSDDETSRGRRAPGEGTAQRREQEAHPTTKLSGARLPSTKRPRAGFHPRLAFASDFALKIVLLACLDRLWRLPPSSPSRAALQRQ